MIIVTTSFIPGRTIAQSLGVISANAITDARAFNDVFANGLQVMASKVRNKDRLFDKALASARRSVMENMVHELEGTAANAVIDLSFDLEVVQGPKSSVFLLSGYGTAVTVE